MMLVFGTSAVFDEVPETINDPAEVSTSPIVKPRRSVFVFSKIVWSMIDEITGASFTGATVRRKLVLFVNCPSLTNKVISVVPFWFVGGEIVTVRFEPEPP